jgi:hypothetical protein
MSGGLESNPGDIFYSVAELFLMPYMSETCYEQFDDVYGFSELSGFEEWGFYNVHVLTATFHCFPITPMYMGNVTSEIRLPPRVKILGVDLCSDLISIQLEPSGANGLFNLTLLGTTPFILVNSLRSGGAPFPVSFVEVLPGSKTYYAVLATWTVDFYLPVTSQRPALFTTLGDFSNTCYYTPLEWEFGGNSVNRCVHDGACTWSTRDFLYDFLGAVDMQGSGLNIVHVAVRAGTAACSSSAPSSCPQWKYMYPGNIYTATGTMPTVDYTLAGPSNLLGDSVYVKGFGCRKVEDVGGSVGSGHFDHYMGLGVSSCSGWGNPTRKAIKIN